MITLVIFLALTTSETKTAGYSCEDVRRLVAEKGKVVALAMAVEHGLSIRQIYQIRRACKV
jgi:hypothetical protein